MNSEFGMRLRVRLDFLWHRQANALRVIGLREYVR